MNNSFYKSFKELRVLGSFLVSHVLSFLEYFKVVSDDKVTFIILLIGFPLLKLFFYLLWSFVFLFTLFFKLSLFVLKSCQWVFLSVPLPQSLLISWQEYKLILVRNQIISENSLSSLHDSFGWRVLDHVLESMVLFSLGNT